MVTHRHKFHSAAEVFAPSRHAIDFSHCTDKTIQSAKDDCDINVIMRRFGATGQVPPPKAEPFYGDFSQVDDFQSAMNMVVAARESFQALPANVRQRFRNDPNELISFLQDDKNLDEARSLGLCNPAVAAPEPQLVRVVPESGGPPAGGPPGPRETGGPGGPPVHPAG